MVVVCKVIFMSNPTAVLRLCSRWGCDNRLISIESHPKKIVVVVVVVIGFVVVVVVHVVVVVIPGVDPRNLPLKFG